MKIVAARLIVTCPGWNFVNLKIETDQGVYGIDAATLNGRELSVDNNTPNRPITSPKPVLPIGHCHY